MFDTHKLNDAGFEEVKTLKSTMADVMAKILPLMPDGREKSIFMTKIEEGMFFGTKAIASKEGNFTEIIKYTTF
ncbi:hypothetical protein UFOVP610_56 [uncultured Caudovirales phage]|uniref:Acb2/Tad1 hairpin domain-containing protein n=1 Tax=uncultured Caudovirales phage TaxID=2100421 RepID=A0A6J5N3F8_9CAUD|nr:hypothetical protein UFOVP610_56 [uncultured Caudovirales phage]